MAEDRFYLNTGPDPKGRGVLAVITIGSPQKGNENCTVCTLEILKDQAAANAWFERMMAERPWESRN